MKTKVNKFGEKQTDWISHKHPDNPNFMQVVRYMHIETREGRNILYWCLVNSSTNDKHMIANITLTEAKKKYVDIEEKELTEADFQKWLSVKNATH